MKPLNSSLAVANNFMKHCKGWLLHNYNNRNWLARASSCKTTRASSQYVSERVASLKLVYRKSSFAVHLHMTVNHSKKYSYRYMWYACLSGCPDTSHGRALLNCTYELYLWTVLMNCTYELSWDHKVQLQVYVVCLFVWLPGHFTCIACHRYNYTSKSIIMHYCVIKSSYRSCKRAWYIASWFTPWFVHICSCLFDDHDY